MKLTERKYKEIREEIFQAEENLRKLSYKTWAILFASSFLIYLWSDSMTKFMNSNTIVLIPVIINATTWIFWFMANYISLLKPMNIRLSERHQELEHEEIEFKNVYLKWEYLNYRLVRQRRYIRIIELFISLQLALIPIIWAMSFFIF